MISIINKKGGFWQVGQWVHKLEHATKYRKGEAENVMAMAPRKFHDCRVVENPHAFKQHVTLPALPQWEFPTKEVEAAPYGVTLGFFNQPQE